MSFNFGGGGNANSSFSFGTTPKTTAPAASAGFSFGATSNAGTAPPKPGGFSFGTQGASTPAGGFSFNTPTNTASASAPPNTQLSFGTPQAASTLGFSSAAATSTTAPTGFSLGATAAAPKPAAAGFSFGTPASTATAAGTTGFTLGGAVTTAGTSLGGLAPAGGLTLGGAGAATLGGSSVPAATGGLTFGTTQTAAAAPASGFSFGTKPTGIATPSTQAAAPAASLTLGGLKPAGTAATTAATFQLGGQKPATTGLTGLVAPSVAASSTGLTGLLAPSVTASIAPTAAPALKIGGIATTTSSAAGVLGGGFKLGGTTTVTTTALGASSGLFGTAATATTAASLSTATSTTASGMPGPTKNYRQLEEDINKWTIELEEQEKIFLQQATQVNAWDRLLIDNGEKITQLNTDVERVKIDQQRLDHELDFILAQQGELEALLVPLEKEVEQLPPINYQQHANPEREHTYRLAENLDAQLKRMVQDLKEIIDHLNVANSSQENTDPVHQIAKILNAHMDSLQWIDQNTSLLQRRVDDVSKQAELRRKEQERNFRLAYD